MLVGKSDFFGCLALGFIFERRLPEGGGIAKGRALPKIYRADGQTEALQSLYCLLMALAS